MVALVGRNGSGKSTLIKTIAGLLSPLSGSIALDKLPHSEIPAHRRAKITSFVAAGTSEAPNLRASELVALGRYPHTNWMGSLDKHDREVIHSAIEWVGMMEKADHQFHRLSDGEKQRIMIARALAQDTPIMLFDEPTAFLDLPNKFEMIRLMDTLKKRGKTLLFSTHDIETAWLWADKFWVLHDRSLIEGAPEDMGLNGTYGRLFEDSDLSFSLDSQRFEYPVKTISNISLDRDDHAGFFWTSRAFRRAGLSIVSKGEAHIHVSICGTGMNISWTVSHGGEVNEFFSIYDLISYLVKIST